jgi:hypothetical protein
MVVPCLFDELLVRRVCRYQRGNHNTMTKRKNTKEKQRFTKHTHKTKDRVTGNSLKTGGGLGCSGRVSSSWSSSGTRRVNLVANPLISREWGKDREVLRQVEHIRGNFWHRYSIAVNQVMVATVILQLNQEEPLVQ